MTLFNQRKIVYVISDNNIRIAELLREELSQDATFIKGIGAYSGADKLILMAITNNIQLKKLVVWFLVRTKMHCSLLRTVSM
jgi:uncharacterized membrane-anchored protein YitT (DUF2179 family)